MVVLQLTQDPFLRTSISFIKASFEASQSYSILPASSSPLIVLISYPLYNISQPQQSKDGYALNSTLSRQKFSPRIGAGWVPVGTGAATALGTACWMTALPIQSDGVRHGDLQAGSAGKGRSSLNHVSIEGNSKKLRIRIPNDLGGIGSIRN
ncbi:hypothetical protein PIB30_102124 [Stylosanthes scabra]|uniref:Uncharacterized protein n=1 Tax=Stylosanthes scabra TaxID=79078 RepID=A0ABU6VW37_9FABA|nr:hypothetical protein [Stylosanthes scabra]